MFSLSSPIEAVGSSVNFQFKELSRPTLIIVTIMLNYGKK
jgi:hypothetical protein